MGNHRVVVRVKAKTRLSIRLLTSGGQKRKQSNCKRSSSVNLNKNNWRQMQVLPSKSPLLFIMPLMSFLASVVSRQGIPRVKMEAEVVRAACPHSIFKSSSMWRLSLHGSCLTMWRLVTLNLLRSRSRELESMSSFSLTTTTDRTRCSWRHRLVKKRKPSRWLSG